MKVLRIILLSMTTVLLLSTLAHGAPFLACDPQAGVQKYRVNIASEGIINEESDAEVDGSCLHDVGPWPVGSYSGTIEAGGDYVLDGSPQGVWVWSDPAPFDLTKPGPTQPNLQAVVP